MHVIGPELGLTQPGMTIVCGDSHTTTHGAFGALAFGIGTTEVEQVLATQCLVRRKPKAMRVELDGALAPGVSAKDAALWLSSASSGMAGGTGHVIEFGGSLIPQLSMEQRMTLCNMSIEAGRHRRDRPARRGDVQLPRRPPLCAGRRRLAGGGVAVADAGERSRRAVRSRRAHRRR